MIHLLLFSSLKERSPDVYKERHPKNNFNSIEKQIIKEYALYDFVHFISCRYKYACKYMENFRMRLGNGGNRD